MTIKVGDKLPEAKFRVMTADGLQVRTTDDVFKGKKVALFAVPGAFTPTCSNLHMPSFLSNVAAFKAKGVDAVAVTAVNDAFVMKQWAEKTGGDGKIDFLADGSADFAKAIDMTLDASGNGLGIRSKRYALIVDDGTVKWMGVEDAPGKLEKSGADQVLQHL